MDGAGTLAGTSRAHTPGHAERLAPGEDFDKSLIDLKNRSPFGQRFFKSLLACF